MRYLILLFACLNCAFGKEVLDVVLSTEKSLSPIYVSQIYNNQSSFSCDYLQKLQSVLIFDLNYNGHTIVQKSDPQSDTQLNAHDKQTAFNHFFWQKKGVKYVLKIESNNKNLKFLLFQNDRNQVKTFPEIILTGALSQDRKKIHKMSDLIVESFFDCKGIAQTRLIYSVKTKNSEGKNESNIWVSDYDGANARKLTDNLGYCVHPVFIPQKNGSDCQNYIFVSYKTGVPKIYRGSINSSSHAPIIHLGGNQLLPCISKTADKIAFITDAAGRADLFLQTFDGNGRKNSKPRQLFSAPYATQASPSFSPDGKKIAFVSDKDGTPRIFVMLIPENPKITPSVQLITRKNRQNVTPVWSYDGTKLAYSAKTDDVRQIWIYDFEKNEEWQLTRSTKNMENPYWAPDSLHLVYNSEDDKTGISELFIINLNQKEAVKISEGFGRKRFPAWEPR